MSEQPFPCDVIRTGAVRKSVIYIFLNAVVGFGLLAYIFHQIGLKNLISLAQLVLAAGAAIYMLLFAWSKGSELWQFRKSPVPDRSILVITDRELEHRFGLTKFVIPIESILDVRESEKSGAGIEVTLKDGVPVTLPSPIKEKEFMIHLRSRLARAS